MPLPPLPQVALHPALALLNTEALEAHATALALTAAHCSGVGSMGANSSSSSGSSSWELSAVAVARSIVRGGGLLMGYGVQDIVRR